jgi:hypothetical protein
VQVPPQIGPPSRSPRLTQIEDHPAAAKRLRSTLAVSEEWPQEFHAPGRSAVSRIRYNFKRRIGRLDDPEARARLADAVQYGGNPEHKRNPGDFGLTPPASPRPDKTLCDTVELFERSEALRLLRLSR